MFDTTYSINSLTSYQEGVEFAKQLLRLVNEVPDLQICLKEKKFRSDIDLAAGETLTSIYAQLERHPRIKFYSRSSSSSDLISSSDACISFPFTSTTFEALSANRLAIWHDPCGLYKKTAYAQLRGAMTHGYEALREWILVISQSKNQEYLPAIQQPQTPLLDPFRDGHAINRFRELLTATAGDESIGPTRNQTLPTP